jgi:hypothetical protein
LRNLARRQLLRHAFNIATGAGALLAPAASGQGINARWDLEVRGRAINENGDLRFEKTSGRILMQFDDSAFQPLQDLKIASGTISFTLPRTHRHFDGTVTDSLMSGVVRDADGGTQNWMALPLRPGSTRWPVPPRVTARQLVMGSAVTTVRVPGTWLAAMPALAELEGEDRDLANLAGLPPVNHDDRMARSRRLALGLDESGRARARALLARIGSGPAGSPEFRRIFGAGSGWKLDLHDVALAEALHYLSGFQLSQVADGLRQLGDLAGVADSSMIRESAWRLWCRTGADSAQVFASIDSLARRDTGAALAVRALLAGYDQAAVWWRGALHWLLFHRWLDTPSGPRSPQQLMANFWSTDSLDLPAIVPTRFGDEAAMPVPAADYIGPYLFRPRNAVAGEWLAGKGMREAFQSWLPIRWGESPLTVVIGGYAETVVSPWAQAQARPAAFFGERDAVRIDPGITPVVAVVVFIHEWHHLVAARRRLQGPRPAALDDDGTELRLRELDPWLAEGFAEWATEETLRPARSMVPLLLFTQAEKRLAGSPRDSTDPHLLGYRLVRAAAKQAPVNVLRDRLVATLHDATLLARTLHLSGSSATPVLMLNRPPNASVIPEVSFTWDDGLAFDMSRRLVIPNTRREH